MRLIYAEYNMYHNSIDVTTFDGYVLRIDCNVAEDGLRTTPGSQCALNALAIDEPLEYATLALDGNKQIDDHTLVALTIMIAESKPDEKEMMISVIMNCICG